MRYVRSSPGLLHGLAEGCPSRDWCSLVKQSLDYWRALQIHLSKWLTIRTSISCFTRLPTRAAGQCCNGS
jgi:hypothetical protein